MRTSLENFDRPRSRLLQLFLWILLFYAAGTFVRSTCGTHWEINNKSGAPLNCVTLRFVGWKYQDEILLHDFAPGQVRRFFFSPHMKSSYFFNFIDPQSVRHIEQGNLDIGGTDSYDIKVTILPSNKVEMSLPTHRVSWESWLSLL